MLTLTCITLVTRPDMTEAPDSILTISKTPGTIINKFLVTRVRVSAVVVAAQVFIAFLCVPWPAIMTFPCLAHLSSVGSAIISYTVKVYEAPICRNSFRLKVEYRNQDTWE